MKHIKHKQKENKMINNIEYEIQTYNTDTGEFCNYDGLTHNALCNCIDTYKQYDDITLLIAVNVNDEFKEFLPTENMVSDNYTMNGYDGTIGISY